MNAVSFLPTLLIGWKQCCYNYLAPFTFNPVLPYLIIKVIWVQKNKQKSNQNHLKFDFKSKLKITAKQVI